MRFLTLDTLQCYGFGKRVDGLFILVKIALSSNGKKEYSLDGMKMSFANLALLCVFAVKFSFFNRKVRNGLRKGRKVQLGAFRHQSK